MKLKKSERKLLEKRKSKLNRAIDAYSFFMENEVVAEEKYLLPSMRYLSKVVDSLIYTRMDFVNKDGSEIGGIEVSARGFDAPENDTPVYAAPLTPFYERVLEKVSNNGVTCSEEKNALVTEGNLVVS